VAGAGDAAIAEMASSAGTARELAPDDLAIQVPLILATLEALGIAVVGHDGYEADDVIGTLAATAPMPVDVVSGDRDLFQVVDDARQVRVLYIARGVGKHEVVDNAWVQAKYQIPAAAYVDYATLRGDASDGLPGVSGIGEKTAASLIASYHDLEGILAAASRPQSPVSSSVSAKLAAAIDYLAVAPAVVTVVRDLDLGVSWDDLVTPGAPRHEDRFAELTELLNLGSSADRIRASLAAAATA
jgi:5'-3' exonuclease